MTDQPLPVAPPNQPPPRLNAVRVSGSETRTLHLDAIEAALRVPGRRGANLPRNLAEDVLLRQLAQCERIRKQLDKHIAKAVDADKDWLPPIEIVESSSKNTQAIRSALAELRALRKDAKDSRKGLTDEQLDKVLVHSLRRVASQLPDAQWWEFVAVKFGENVADVLVPGQRKAAA